MRYSSRHGYIALVGVILLGSALLIALLALAFGMNTGSKIARRNVDGTKSYYLAMSCAEVALEKLWEDSNYGGNEMLTFNEGLCGILPLEEESGQKIIKSYGSFADTTRRLKITIATTSPQILISSWQEVADF